MEYIHPAEYALPTARINQINQELAIIKSTDYSILSVNEEYRPLLETLNETQPPAYEQVSIIGDVFPSASTTPYQTSSRMGRRDLIDGITDGYVILRLFDEKLGRVQDKTALVLRRIKECDDEEPQEFYEYVDATSIKSIDKLDLPEIGTGKTTSEIEGHIRDLVSMAQFYNQVAIEQMVLRLNQEIQSYPSQIYVEALVNASIAANGRLINRGEQASTRKIFGALDRIETSYNYRDFDMLVHTDHWRYEPIKPGTVFRLHNIDGTKLQ